MKNLEKEEAGQKDEVDRSRGHLTVFEEVRRHEMNGLQENQGWENDVLFYTRLGGRERIYAEED